MVFGFSLSSDTQDLWTRLEQLEKQINEVNTSLFNQNDIFDDIADNHKQIYAIRDSFLGLNPEKPKNQASYIAIIIYLEAIKNDIDPHLLTAIGIVESRLNQSAISSVGAVGMFQLTYIVEKIYNVNAIIFEENVAGAAKFISDLINVYGDVKLALAHYNGGSNPRYKIEHYPETKKYVKDVMKIYESFN